MSRPIDGDQAFRLLTDQIDKETGAYSKGRNAGLNVARSMMNNAQALPTLTLNTLRDAIYEDAVKHGLWEDDEDYMPTDCVFFIKDEVCELDCAAMDWEDDVCNDNSAFCDELSDVIIMCLSVAGYLGIDIDAAVRRKMEINRVRPWKHGKDEKK